jgi:hypothetical protein
MKVTFLAKGIKEVKSNFVENKNIEKQIEKFRENMLAKHDLLFKNAPHILKFEE